MSKLKLVVTLTKVVALIGLHQWHSFRCRHEFYWYGNTYKSGVAKSEWCCRKCSKFEERPYTKDTPNV